MTRLVLQGIATIVISCKIIHFASKFLDNPNGTENHFGIPDLAYACFAEVRPVTTWVCRERSGAPGLEINNPFFYYRCLPT